jgi:ornithine cyclodeaminase
VVALAAKLLAPKILQSIGTLGTGIQARYQLEMLPTVTECRNVLVWGRNASKANAFRDEMVQKGWHVHIADPLMIY